MFKNLWHTNKFQTNDTDNEFIRLSPVYKAVAMFVDTVVTYNICINV